MPISVTTAAVATDMITVEDIPASIRGTSNANDPDLARLIRQTSAAISRYLGYVLAEQTYQEDVPGYGDTLLEIMVTPTLAEALPPGGPVTSVTSVNLLDIENGSNPTAITDFLIADAAAGHLYRRSGWAWTGQNTTGLVPHPTPQSERPLYRVIYVAGWTMPRPGAQATTTAGSLPHDLRQAAVESVVAAYYRQLQDTRVISRQMADVRITYADPTPENPFGFPEVVIGLLSPWRRLG